mgnify:FL=1
MGDGGGGGGGDGDGDGDDGNGGDGLPPIFKGDTTLLASHASMSTTTGFSS